MEPTTFDPMSQEALDALLLDIKGFGIKDNEEIITMTVGGRRLQLRITNLSNEDEIFSMLRSEGLNGYPWIHRTRCELLARAITWINGVTIDEGLYASAPSA